MALLRLAPLKHASLRNSLRSLAKCWCSNLSMNTTSGSIAPPFSLLGPPEIYLSKETQSSQDSATPENQTQPLTGDPFMDSMVSSYNHISPKPKPPMGFTENWSPTYLSSGNHCLDFFFHVVPDTPAEEVVSRLQVAWGQNPLTALKLVFNLRGVRGTGKSDRGGFYAAALWLHENHPKTLASNAQSVAEFGYFKDLPLILHFMLQDTDLEEALSQVIRKKRVRYSKDNPSPCCSKEAKKIEAAKKAIERYQKDSSFRYLHDQISDVFAQFLKNDLQKLSSDHDFRNISLAAKWCPSLASPLDQSTLLCESIARRLFPRDSYPEYEGIEDAHYAYRVRERLRKEVLVPLRKALKLPEVYMSANQWSLIHYSRVPSVAMKNYTEAFSAHDLERFQGYLEKVKKGEAKIAAGALYPHEIIASIRGDGGEVAVLQWERMVQDLSQLGKLKNCLAICDVSGSMSGTPLDVSVALGLLVSDLSEEPWRGKLITFSSKPELQIIKGDNLQDKIKSIERMDWEMNTDFQKVFDQILLVAKSGNITEEQMIKRLFVFSDMEFDEASSNSWETDYEAITRKFKENGYESVPEIVFWNLRNSRATPVPSHQKGVALLSGFSKNLLKLFLKEGDVFNPEATMELAISGPEYSKLVIVD